MEEKNMNEKNPVMVPYIVHESILSRQERQIKRLWILCVIIFLALVITNAGWICYEAQYETISYEQDGYGYNNINTGDQGDLYNGTEAQMEETEGRQSEGREDPQAEGD